MVSFILIKRTEIPEASWIWLIDLLPAGSSRVPFVGLGIMTDFFKLGRTGAAFEKEFEHVC